MNVDVTCVPCLRRPWASPGTPPLRLCLQDKVSSFLVVSCQASLNVLCHLKGASGALLGALRAQSPKPSTRHSHQQKPNWNESKTKTQLQLREGASGGASRPKPKPKAQATETQLATELATELQLPTAKDNTHNLPMPATRQDTHNLQLKHNVNFQLPPNFI